MRWPSSEDKEELAGRGSRDGGDASSDSRGIFTTPEAASAGLATDEFREAKDDAKSSRADYRLRIDVVHSRS